MFGLKSWKRHLKDTIEEGSWNPNANSDHPDCPNCGNEMDFYGHDDDGDFPYGEGYWACPNCGFKITEDEL